MTAQTLVPRPIWVGLDRQALIRDTTDSVQRLGLLDDQPAADLAAQTERALTAVLEIADRIALLLADQAALKVQERRHVVKNAKFGGCLPCWYREPCEARQALRARRVEINRELTRPQSRLARIGRMKP